MATVRITKDLTTGIISKLRDQFEVRRRNLKTHIAEGFEPMKSQYFEDLLTTILEQSDIPRDIYDAIPNGWCHTTSRLKAFRLNNVTSEVLPAGNPLGKPIKVPENLNYLCESLRLEHPRLQPYAEYASLANAQLAQLAREETESIHMANSLLTQAGSLKQALDVWPHLMELLPDWAIKQHNKPSEKRQKSKITAIDTDKLTGAVVAGKMAVATLNR